MTDRDSQTFIGNTGPSKDTFDLKKSTQGIPRDPNRASWPHPFYDVDNDLAFSIGVLCMLWARIELIPQKLIWIYAGIDEEVGLRMTSELGKRDIHSCLLSLIEHKEPDEGIKLSISYAMTCYDILLGNRNLIIHNLFRINKEDESLSVTRVSNKGKLNISNIPVSIEDVRRTCDETQEITFYFGDLIMLTALNRKHANDPAMATLGPSPLPDRPAQPKTLFPPAQKTQKSQPRR